MTPKVWKFKTKDESDAFIAGLRRGMNSGGLGFDVLRQASPDTGGFEVQLLPIESEGK